GPDNITREAVFLDRGSSDEEWYSLGKQGSVNVPPGVDVATPARRRQVGVGVVVLVGRERSEQLVEARAWGIVELCRNAIRADVRLGGVADWAGVSRTEQSSYADGVRGHVAQVVLTVSAHLR